MKFIFGLLLAMIALIALYFVFASPQPVEDTDGSIFKFISSAEADTLDPQEASWSGDFRLVECLYESLLEVDGDGNVNPATADKWEVSDDLLTYTFHIRDNAKWSDGSPVTSHDYSYAWRRALTPDFAASYYKMLTAIKGGQAYFDKREKDLEAFTKSDDKSAATAQALWDATKQDFAKSVGIATPDDKTIVVTLEQVTPYFLELVGFATFCPVHKASVEKLETVDAITGMVDDEAAYFGKGGRPVSNGAYVLAERKLDNYTRLAQNPHYWNVKEMGNKGIHVRIIKNPGTALLEYEQGNTHWLPDTPSGHPLASALVKQLDAGKRKDVHRILGNGTYFYHFNCKPMIKGKANPLANPKVRRALSMAIDREKIVKDITKLNQPTSMTFTPVALLNNYAPPVEAGASYDPQAARKLLAEAGFPGGEGLNDLSIVFNSNASHESVVQQVQANWKKELGVSVGSDPAEKNRFMQIRRGHEFTVARGGWLGDYRDPTTFLNQFHSQNGHNDSAYNSPQFDTLLEQAGMETDATKRLKILHQAETVLMQDQPIAPIYQYMNVHVYDPDKIKHLDPNPWNTLSLEKVKVLP